MPGATRYRARAARGAARELVESLGGRVVGVGLQQTTDGYEVVVSALEPFSERFYRKLKKRGALVVENDVPVVVVKATTVAHV